MAIGDWIDIPGQPAECLVRIDSDVTRDGPVMYTYTTTRRDGTITEYFTDNPRFGIGIDLPLDMRRTQGERLPTYVSPTYTGTWDSTETWKTTTTGGTWDPSQSATFEYVTVTATTGDFVWSEASDPLDPTCVVCETSFKTGGAFCRLCLEAFQYFRRKVLREMLKDLLDG